MNTTSARTWFPLVLVSGLLVWGWAPIALDPKPSAFIPLATIVLIAPSGFALGLRSRQKTEMTAAERKYAHIVGALLGLPIAFCAALLIGGGIAALSGETREWNNRVLFVALLGVPIGAAVGPWMSSALVARRTRWALPLFPLVTLALLYTAVVTARISYGHWPSYGNPDAGAGFPGRPMVAVADAAAFVGLGLGLISPAALLFLVPWSHRQTDEGKHALVSGAAFIGAYAVWVVVLWIDPGQYVNWLMD